MIEFVLSNTEKTSYKCKESEKLTDKDGNLDLSHCDLSQLLLKPGKDSIKNLQVKDNAIEILENECLVGALNLIRIDLGNNKISEIECQAFVDQRQLETLVLTNNKIKNLPSEIFDRLNKLKVLNLEGNLLEIISVDLFRRNPELVKLVLDNNQILAIQRETFSHLTKVHILNLLNNICINDSTSFAQKTKWNETFSTCYNNYALIFSNEDPYEVTTIILSFAAMLLSIVLSILIGFIIKFMFYDPSRSYDVRDLREPYSSREYYHH